MRGGGEARGGESNHDKHERGNGGRDRYTEGTEDHGETRKEGKKEGEKVRGRGEGLPQRAQSTPRGERRRVKDLYTEGHGRHGQRGEETRK